MTNINPDKHSFYLISISFKLLLFENFYCFCCCCFYAVLLTIKKSALPTEYLKRTPKPES